MTMLLPSFDLHQPKSLQELENLIREFPEFDVLAGGSDLLPNYKCGLNAKEYVISLQHIAELKKINNNSIGAMTTLHELENSEHIKMCYPIIYEAASKIASPLIRRQATVGGNLHLDTRCHFFNQSYFWRRSLGYCLKADGDVCHVVPKIKVDGQTVTNNKICYATNSSDLAPAFIVLGAQIEFLGPQGKRLVDLSEFYRHDGIDRFRKEPGEIMTAVYLPDKAEHLKAGYRKLRPREAWDFPVLGVAVALKQDRDGSLETFSICVNAVDTYPLQMSEITSQWMGKKLTIEEIEMIADQVKNSIQPKLNVPMQPSYRKKMSAVFVKRLLKELLDL